MQIFLEEANKVLGGVNAASGDDESGATTAQQFQDMWRDGRKYLCWPKTHIRSKTRPSG